MLELREDTIEFFHKYKIPLLNAVAKAMPSIEVDMELVRFSTEEKPVHTVVKIRLNEKIVNFGFDDEFDAILWLRGMVSMKDLLTSRTVEEYIKNAMISSN